MPVAPARLAPDRQLGQVTAQLIAKNMNIAPTLEIRPGYRFNVIVTKDMTFFQSVPILRLLMTPGRKNDQARGLNFSR